MDVSEIGPMTIAPRPVTPKDVKAFIIHYSDLQKYRSHNDIIFNNEVLQIQLLQRVSPFFFHDLNILLIKHIILQICALTDKGEMTFKKKKYYNLTVDFLVTNSDFSRARGKGTRLRKLAERIAKFRAKIEPARHKRVGHLDLDAAMSRKSLGRASLAAWRKFWRDFHEFTLILQQHYLPPKQQYDLNVRESDADQLVKAIRESTYFHAAMKDHSITLRLDDIARASHYYPRS
jgi:hypothetical protein